MRVNRENAKELAKCLLRACLLAGVVVAIFYGFEWLDKVFIAPRFPIPAISLVITHF